MSHGLQDSTSMTPYRFSVENWAKTVLKSPYFGMEEVAESSIDLSEKDDLSRFERSLLDVFFVAPLSSELFVAYSFRDGELKRYRVSSEDCTCECKDYIYNTSVEPHMNCKHVLRVKFLQRKNMLPEDAVMNISWVRQLCLHLNQTTQYTFACPESIPTQYNAEYYVRSLLSKVIGKDITQTENLRSLLSRLDD